ncbi:hypothetical protein GCM10023335_47150 [Streptomyces siamensis]|uniref:Uncharacterized protein n=1 Tax=Streptomyces siamensis TaxID=1274986 RepID=A0ABP9J2U8_9ACTN
MLWTSASEAGEGSRVSRASTAAKATMAANASSMVSRRTGSGSTFVSRAAGDRPPEDELGFLGADLRPHIQELTFSPDRADLDDRPDLASSVLAAFPRPVPDAALPPFPPPDFADVFPSDFAVFPRAEPDADPAARLPDLTAPVRNAARTMRSSRFRLPSG